MSMGSWNTFLPGLSEYRPSFAVLASSVFSHSAWFLCLEVYQFHWSFQIMFLFRLLFFSPWISCCCCFLLGRLLPSLILLFFFYFALDLNWPSFYTFLRGALKLLIFRSFSFPDICIKCLNFFFVHAFLCTPPVTSFISFHALFWCMCVSIYDCGYVLICMCVGTCMIVYVCEHMCAWDRVSVRVWTCVMGCVYGVCVCMTVYVYMCICDRLCECRHVCDRVGVCSVSVYGHVCLWVW